ncbi:PA0069 family radical SAM protein [Novosphingobium sp. 9U]|uniref:PA0069 family radical SAM protein n=1 Tax=Novosphingobium sp. 9U TaxID=2653158 RepID=UPI0012F44D66|nr:PA0069 family radical SAM protein [Novosphingobium sp. 9U]VWX52018.1 DNA repair photolyase [Novosphingobium sp. 9U]
MADRAHAHGRGAQSSSVSARFNLAAREEDGDWQDVHEFVDGPVDRLRTTVTEEHPKAILTFNSSPDVPFDRSINAYRGCEHGCIYCFARPSHAYHDLSPGLDFETKLFAKPDAARLLRETLAKPSYRPAPIAMGTNTDPYQPIEARYRITRQVLEVCLETRHPVTITTKSDRVLQDLDLITELARHGLIWVGISVTSLDPKLSRLLEPRAASPAKRVAALGALVAAGVPCHVSVAPVIPSITDHQIEQILAEAAAAGVRAATWIIVRLPNEVAPLFREWLETHFPDRAAKVMATIRSIRGGRDNDPRFGKRMKPEGVWADLFRSRFAIAMRRHGMARPDVRLDCTAFRKPSADGQLSLL